MAFIRENTIDEVIARASIVSTVSEYTNLTKVGNRFRGLCPFHNEKNPSFYVSAEKNLFKCFGCNEGGNVIHFIMKKENLTFPEAVVKLGQKYGITITTSEKKSHIKSQAARFYEINSIALRYFKNNMSEVISNYLEKRGLDSDAVKVFEIGYAPPSWNGMANYLKRNGVSEEEALKIGLTVKGEKGTIYDRFRGRIIFPIHNVSGEISGFGGRVLDDRDIPKYLNSSESPIYQKSKLLYGLSFAKDAIRKEGYIILCEGYFDFLSLFTNGFKNSVALCGTALSEEHLRLIKKYTDRVVLILDSDEAGIKAMLKTFSLFVKSDLDARVVILPGNNDPDSFLKESGKNRMSELLIGARPILDFFINYNLSRDNSINARNELIKRILNDTAFLNDSLKRELVFLKISEIMGVPVKVIHEHCVRSSNHSRGGDVADSPKSLKIPKEERLLFKAAFINPALFKIVKKDSIAEKLSSTELKRVWREVENRESKNGKFEIDKIMAADLEPVILNLISELLIDNGEIGKESSEKIFYDCLAKINKRLAKEKSSEWISEIRQAEKNGKREQAINLLKEKYERIHG